MDPLVAVALAYAVGCVSFASLAARIKGVDLREHGSGNPGATNVGRVLGRPWGIAVLILDVGKGFVPVLLLRGPADWVEGGDRVLILAAAVLGHVYPVTMGFRGGKGVATLVGGDLALDWVLGLGAVVIHFAVRRATGYVSVASVVLAWAFPLLQLVAERVPALGDRYTAGTPVLVLLAVLITLRHASNFRRIRAGSEDRYDGEPQPVEHD